MFEGKNVVVTGGNRGLGLALVEAFAARGARVTAVARDQTKLAEVRDRLGVAVVPGDVSDPAVARGVVRELRPDILVSNAAGTPHMAPIQEQTWEQFTAPWNNDTRATFHLVQECIRLPLPRGSRVLLTSSGAALRGSPLSGGYAGAKKMIWFMASYANFAAGELDLGLRFQAVVPLQIVAGTEHGETAAREYARRRGITREAFLANFGKAMTPATYAGHVLDILTDPAHAAGTAFGVKGDSGVTSLDG